MFLVNAYKTIEPALAGASFGTVPTFGGFYSKKKEIRKVFCCNYSSKCFGVQCFVP